MRGTHLPKFPPKPSESGRSPTKRIGLRKNHAKATDYRLGCITQIAVDAVTVSRGCCWSGPPDHVDGNSIVLARQAGADSVGYLASETRSIITGGVQSKAALPSTLHGVGQLGATTGVGTNADVIMALRRGASDSVNQTESHSTQFQYPADTHDPAELSSAGHHQW